MHSMQFNIRISSNCINCIRCVAVCPSHVLVRNSANRMVEVGSLGRCIGCGQCAAVCPTHALHHSAYRRRRYIRSKRKIVRQVNSSCCYARKGGRTGRFPVSPFPKNVCRKLWSRKLCTYSPIMHKMYVTR